MMELVEKLRACFFKAVFVKGTPEAATAPSEKPLPRSRTFRILISLGLTTTLLLTTTLTQADKEREGVGERAQNILRLLTLNRTFSLTWPVTK